MLAAIALNNPKTTRSSEAVFGHCDSVPHLTNTPPTAPLGLSSSVSNQQVTLNWNPSSDAQTPTLGLTSNIRVRMTGQDVPRGTFSHRHAVFYDVGDGRTYTPLAKLSQPGTCRPMPWPFPTMFAKRSPPAILAAQTIPSRLSVKQR